MLLWVSWAGWFGVGVVARDVFNVWGLFRWVSLVGFATCGNGLLYWSWTTSWRSVFLGHESSDSMCLDHAGGYVLVCSLVWMWLAGSLIEVLVGCVICFGWCGVSEGVWMCNKVPMLKSAEGEDSVVLLGCRCGWDGARESARGFIIEGWWRIGLIIMSMLYVEHRVTQMYATA